MIKLMFDDIQARISSGIPEMLLESARKLNFDIYAVGGCVRDALLGKPVNDIDIAVVGDAAVLANATAEKLEDCKVAIYSRFGTALLSSKAFKIELATARAESYRSDSRKPVVVEPVSIDRDLMRRDFTINAIAVGLTGNDKDSIIDLYSGSSDLEYGIIRTPLEPNRTFSDDPLRMLRAIRFAANLNFNIHQDTWKGIQRNSDRLKLVPFERIGEEFWKMLSGPDPVRAIRMLISRELMVHFMPEVVELKGVQQIGKHHHKDVLIHTLKVMQNVVDNSDDPVLRLAALLHDVGKPLTKRFDNELGWTFHGHEAVGAKMTRRIGRRLSFAREDLNKLVKLVSLHMRPVNLTSEGVSDSAIRRLMVDAGEELEDQLILCRADITSGNSKLVAKYLENFNEIEKRMSDVEARDRMRSFQSPVRGDEIIAICKIQPGPLVGVLKERIEDAILDGRIPYDYDAAKSYLLSIKDEVLTLDSIEIKKERKERAMQRSAIDRSFEFPD